MRRKKWMEALFCRKRLAAFGLAGGLAVAQLTGCGTGTTDGAGSGTPASEAAAGDPAAGGQAGDSAADSTQGEAGQGTVSSSDGGAVSQASGGRESGATGVTYSERGMTAELGEGGSKTAEYEEEDLDTAWEESKATTIVLSDSGSSVSGANAKVSGSTVEINDGGTFVISGSLSDGQILITAAKDETVHLILNGVEIANSTTAPIYTEKKCKVILTLADGTENVVSDGASYVFETEGEDEPDAPIFVKGDLTINGSGSLTVQGNYQCGIRSKGSLLIVSGTIVVDSQDDGIKGKDSLVILDGNLTIRSGKDGLKSNNDESDEVGFVWIDGGSIAIAAQDDGIQAESALIISGGSIRITESDEAMSGKTVDILGGVIDATATDDGINAALTVETEWEKMADQEGVYVRIAGGEIRLDASADGIDSNGDLYIEGGALYLSGPTNSGNGILDYNGTSKLTGGTIFAAGSSGMMQTFGADSTQNYLVIYYEETQAGGTEVVLADADGNEMGSFAPVKDYQAVIISSPELETGSRYLVTAGENSAELEVSAIETTSGNRGGGMGGGFGGGMGGGGRGNRGEMGAAPESGGTDSGTPGESSEGAAENPGAGSGMPGGRMPGGGGGRPQGGASGM